MTHWTETDFERWIYGLKDPDEHFHSCPECRAESERLTLVRRRIVTEPEVSREFLFEQRRRIYNRLAHPVTAWRRIRWIAPVAAMLILFVVTFTMTKPRPAVEPLYTHADVQLFSDLTAIDQSNEPEAIKPIHNLFQE